MLAGVQRESIIIHRLSGEEITVQAIVHPNVFLIEDVNVQIEEDDIIIRNLPNESKEYYEIIELVFIGRMGGINAHYQIKTEKIKSLSLQNIPQRQRLVFISHSSRDKEYAKLFVDMLEGIGLDDDQIVCSSYPGLGIPLDKNIYAWLVEKFQANDLHVFFFLSKNYYNSVASLNEMGAAWAMKQKWTGILLPGFDFNEIDGCIDPRQISIKLDGEKEELKHRLGELKDAIITEFGIKPISGTKWERVRDGFLSDIAKVDISENENGKVETGLLINNDRFVLSIYASLMLMYAAENDGRIMVIQDMSGTNYQAGGVILQRNQSGRELAVWEDAVNQLIEKGYIQLISYKNRIYSVTKDGYDISDAFIKDNELDSKEKVNELLCKFGE